MLQQEAMIEGVRELCEDDGRVVAALTYGSFALGEGDRFSDIVRLGGGGGLRPP